MLKRSTKKVLIYAGCIASAVSVVVLPACSEDELFTQAPSSLSPSHVDAETAESVESAGEPDSRIQRDRLSLDGAVTVRGKQLIDSFGEAYTRVENLIGKINPQPIWVGVEEISEYRYRKMSRSTDNKEVFYTQGSPGPDPKITANTHTYNQIKLLIESLNRSQTALHYRLLTADEFIQLCRRADYGQESGSFFTPASRLMGRGGERPGEFDTRVMELLTGHGEFVESDPDIDDSFLKYMPDDAREGECLTLGNFESKQDITGWPGALYKCDCAKATGRNDDVESMSYTFRLVVEFR